MGRLFKNIKRIIALAIGLGLVGIVLVAIYFVYLDTNASAAKSYLVKKYGINEKDLKAKNYFELVYEDVADCDNLWLNKECSSDKDLTYKYVFEYNDTTIIVLEDYKKNLTDDANLTPVETDTDNITE